MPRTPKKPREGNDAAEQHLFELSVFLLTAARGCVGNPTSMARKG